MTVSKRKVSLTLDDDLVAELETNPETLSVQVNAAVRDEVARRRRRRALAVLLDELDAAHGPLDGPEDEAEIARFVRLLGGPS